MATLISKATGNWTAAGTWAPVSAASAAELDSEAGSTASTTSYVYSATFTLAASDVDAVAVKIASRTAGASGTLSIVLANHTSPGVREGEVTINATDLHLNAVGWHVFQFSTVSPNGTDVYKIGFKSSVAGTVTLFRDGTAGNWSRAVRLTAAASAPAAADKLIVAGIFTGAAASTSYTVTMDETAAIAALRHAKKPCVTALIDQVKFSKPIDLGDIVILKAMVNYVGRTSMEVGVRVYSEDGETGNRIHCLSGYFTFVAVDKNGRPIEVPQLKPETDEERRRYEEGAARREQRLSHK